MATIDECVFFLTQTNNSSALALSAAFDGRWQSFFDDVRTHREARDFQVLRAPGKHTSSNYPASHRPDFFSAAPTCFETENPFQMQDPFANGTYSTESSWTLEEANKGIIKGIVHAASSDDEIFQGSDSPLSLSSSPVRGAKPTSRKNKKPVFWTDEEHERFLLALRRFNGDDTSGLGFGVAELIATTLGTRSVSQVRSHAQKYFQELRKHVDHAHFAAMY